MADPGSKSEIALREERILSFWKDNAIFDKTLRKQSPKGEFVFFEGPPTANGRPGIHHLESRSFKDAIPRYKTMQGFRVPRRAGWDTHGLPVELEVEKELGFSGKKDIEAYGIEAFNKKCRESVMRYVEEWSRFTDRIGYWVDQSKAYFTFDAPYMESLFSILKKVDTDGRLFKDYKILPWCARCGTALSSHELAQGYEDVKDLALTVKFKVQNPEKIGLSGDVYLLAWTTTPWTLPGNIALAVGAAIEYVLTDADGVAVIVAKERLGAIHPEVNPNVALIQKEFTGADLVGLTYEPLYPYAESISSDTEKGKFARAYTVYAADFVTTEDGTGIVHIAPMYGADDFALGTKENLPKVHTVASDGTFVAGTDFLAGRFVKDEAVAIDILKDIQARGFYFAKGNHAHTYPFCWRCKTPLIYYARDSWFVRMEDLRSTLQAENAKVNWVPAHTRDGRMGEWLAGAKDWAISRERYWGTPLPIWESADGKERLVIGSVAELKEQTKKSGNRYFVMRHGESENNVAGTLNSDDSIPGALTEFGHAQVLRTGASLSGKGITRVITSPLLRTKQTAEVIAETLGLSADAVVVDERIREIQTGTWNGKRVDEYQRSFETVHHLMTKRPDGGESWTDVRQRMGAFLYDLEATYQNETILIVTHGSPMRMLVAASRGMSIREFLYDWKAARDPVNAEVVEVPFVPLPHNDNYELDLHRPYIDDVVLAGKTGELRRVREVMDVWFDSGAMPFAQDHYPFRNKEKVDTVGFPADFISEAIDQTRGWFYTLLAVGVLMGKGSAYKNVICLGHILDEKGQKMSKSRGNTVDPFALMDTYGVDALRFWMYSVNQAGDSKNFDDKTVKEATRALSWLENSAKFYNLFKTDTREAGTSQVIDVWMEARTNQTVATMTKALDAYDLYTATRALAALFEDLSQWYVRRVRDRVRDGDAAALETLQQTLRTSATLLAPFSPFLAESLFQELRTGEDPESVHLMAWPVDTRTEKEIAEGAALESSMSTLRDTASQILKVRQQAGVKVRQILASATVPTGTLTKELHALLAEEVNVQNIIEGDAIALDTALTPDLIALGDERELARAVADARKQLGLSPRDTVTVVRGSGPYQVELSTGMLQFALTVNAS